MTSIYTLLQVQILKGKDKGKTGIVCLVVKERNWCFVEGLNCVSMLLTIIYLCDKENENEIKILREQ